MQIITECGVIAILRGVDYLFFKDIMTESFKVGLDAIEVTMNTEDALKIVHKCRAMIPQGRRLGMGTIRNISEAQAAVEAGAMFLVTPNLDVAVIEFAVSRDIPVITGALTPTEVYTAFRAGATMIKVFPCSAMGGPKYIKDLRGPFEQIPLVAVGGVSLANLADYFNAGVQAVGVSSSLFGKEALLQRNIKELTRNVKIFMEYCLNSKK